MTWGENKAKGESDRLSGINNKDSKAVIQSGLDGEVITKHHSASHASRVLGIQQSNISACCLGKRERAGGYIWKYT